MKIPRVFIDEPLADIHEIALNKDAHKYIVRVLRRNDGDPLVLFNGDGFNYRSTLRLPSQSRAYASIEEKQVNDSESPLKINLVQSLAKGTKLDLVIQKATELGVTQITPVISERSVLRVDESRVDRKLTHWQSVAVSASTQCERSVVPTVNMPVSLNDWIDHIDEPSSCVLLHPTASKALKEINLETLNCSILVGPEGGFTAEEINHAKSRGVTSFNCGPRILRTETAGFTAIAILQSLHGDI